MQEISLYDISGITTKAPYEAALTCERHVRIEISDFVMRILSLLYVIAQQIASVEFVRLLK